MNIFILDENPYLAAQWQHDRHVVKMILESAQMLSTAVRLGRAPINVAQDVVDSCYKVTHQNHPCNLWLRSNAANFAWLTCHLDGLMSEYHRRFGKIHATYELKLRFMQIVTQYSGADRFWTRDENHKQVVHPEVLALAAQHTPFAVCMPDEFKRDNAIDSYRTLYREVKVHQTHVKWTRCANVPEFLSDLPLTHDTTGWTYRVVGPIKLAKHSRPPRPKFAFKRTDSL